MVTQTKHEDAITVPGHDAPAKDKTETIWIGKDRMRIEDADRITIIRMDQKKMYLIDPKAKTVSTIDLPVDMKKYLPEQVAPMYEMMMSHTKAVLTPTTETKKIHDWNATKYTMTMTLPAPPQVGGDRTVTSEIWATKDVAVDRAAMSDMYAAMMSLAPGGAALADEMKKIEGMPVLIERTTPGPGGDHKSRDEVTAVASKDAPEGTYDVPKDFTEKKFDPMSEGGMGGGPQRRHGKPTDAGGDPHKGGDKGGG
jgi:hypothetical protein